MIRRILIAVIVLLIAVPLGFLGYTEYWLRKSGEDWPLKQMTAALDDGPELYYNAYNTDVTIPLRFSLLEADAPDVVVFGSSRVNQFREKMFAPYDFYNLQKQPHSPPIIVNMMKALPEDSRPRVAFVIMDAHLLLGSTPYIETSPDNWSAYNPGRVEMWKYAWALWKDEDARGWLKEDGAGIVWLGGRAIQSGAGTRGTDGSLFYGEKAHNRGWNRHERILDNFSDRAEDQVDAKYLFSGLDRPLNDEVFARLETFRDEMAALGIEVVGFVPPYSVAVQETLDGDPVQYQAWAELQLEDTDQRINDILPYFNFSRFESFGGEPWMMRDSTHPTEQADALMLARMLEDPRVSALLPEIDRQRLIDTANNAELPMQVLFD